MNLVSTTRNFAIDCAGLALLYTAELAMTKPIEPGTPKTLPQRIADRILNRYLAFIEKQDARHGRSGWRADDDSDESVAAALATEILATGSPAIPPPVIVHRHLATEAAERAQSW
jgi:hypothetical protein